MVRTQPIGHGKRGFGFHVRNVPEHLHKLVQTDRIEQGISMESVIIAILTDHYEQHLHEWVIRDVPEELESRISRYALEQHCTTTEQILRDLSEMYGV